MMDTEAARQTVSFGEPTIEPDGSVREGAGDDGA